ncbi:putative sensor domain DACNV-containing protein [Geobacter sp.]|uniref:putative sensor domain DACNV-containing protein n=1 Tax=Geobacter sp. TaxID=46610 RepID=UPI0026224EEC|nr:diadenylate cyclase [Geobacter sp.]
MPHFYPRDFAAFIHEHFEGRPTCPDWRERYGAIKPEAVPGLTELELVISTCYQASLMREEERPVRFRLLLRDPAAFPPDQGPPDGFHRIVFATPRPFDENELRRLSPVVDFYRSLVGVAPAPDGTLWIWGLVQSGPRWVQTVHGGGKSFNPLPPVLVLYVTGPGRITACIGLTTIATLKGGEIACPSLDVFDSPWLPESFSAERTELMALHEAARRREGAGWAPLDPSFVRTIAQHVVRRIVGIIRNSHHGGTILFIPPERVADFTADNRYLNFTYTFVEEEPRQRFRTILLDIMNALCTVFGKAGVRDRPVGWDDYVASEDPRLTLLDEKLFELAHLVASLTAVDGAVVMTRRLEILGFGAEISGKLEKVRCVRRALDLEGTRTEPEHTEGVGTRHRSVYRLCNEVHDAIAIVVSQDGRVRFVKWREGYVTYWDQVATSILDF